MGAWCLLSKPSIHLNSWAAHRAWTSGSSTVPLFVRTHLVVTNLHLSVIFRSTTSNTFNSSMYFRSSSLTWLTRLVVMLLFLVSSATISSPSTASLSSPWSSAVLPTNFAHESQALSLLPALGRVLTTAPTEFVWCSTSRINLGLNSQAQYIAAPRWLEYAILHSIPSIVTKRECTRQYAASVRTFTAAVVLKMIVTASPAVCPRFFFEPLHLDIEGTDITWVNTTRCHRNDLF